jgi:hypothetical protein
MHILLLEFLKFCIPGYNSVFPVESHPVSEEHLAFILRLKDIHSKRGIALLHDGIFLGLFDLDDGGDMFLRNINKLLRYYMALYPKRQNTS